MPTPQRLPKVNQDDGVWGDILRQYLAKEHTNDDTDNAVNGGHQHITLIASTGAANTAPITFTSGTNLSSPVSGAMEYDGTSYYLTPSSAARKKIAMYDPSGGTGDIYYRDSSGNFVRLAAASDGNILSLASGIPSWTSSIAGMALGNTNTITVKDSTSFTVQNTTDTTKQLRFDLSGLTTAHTTTLAIPEVNGTTTVVGTDTSQTITNKWIQQRVFTNTSPSSFTMGITSGDQWNFGPLANNLSLSVTGTPVDGQKIMIRLKDNGTARTITWSASFIASGSARLLTTTSPNMTHHCGFIWDAAKSAWVCLAVDTIGY